MNKPWGIVLNVALLAISGIALLLVALGISFISIISSALSSLWVVGFVAGAVVFFIIGIAIILLLLAYYLWQGNVYVWWALVVLSALGILGNFVSLMSLTAFPVVSLAIDVLLLLGLLHKDTISFINPSINWKGWELED